MNDDYSSAGSTEVWFICLILLDVAWTLLIVNLYNMNADYAWSILTCMCKLFYFILTGPRDMSSYKIKELLRYSFCFFSTNFLLIFFK